MTEMYLKVLMMVLLYIAFNHIGLTKGFYLVEVVLVHLPLIKLWEALMNEVIDLAQPLLVDVKKLKC